MIKAAKTNDISIFEHAEFKTTDLLEVCDIGNTALMCAIANNNNTFALKLLDIDCPEQINQISSSAHQNTPLILSISKGFDREDNNGRKQEDIAVRLLQLKADPNIADSSGRTALHYACLHRDRNSIGLLNRYAAQWDIPDKQGFTPLELYFLDNDTRQKLLLTATGTMQFGAALSFSNRQCDNNLLTSLHAFNKIPTLLPIEAIESQQREINEILLPLYQHAKVLFLKNKKYKKHPETADDDWALFEKGVMEKEARKYNELFSIPTINTTSKESVKSAALLKVYLELKQNTVKMIYKDPASQKGAVDKFKNIFGAALADTDLTSERNCLVTAGIALANLLSIWLVPWVVNRAFFSNSWLFAHQTTTEKLLQQANDTLEKKLTPKSK